MEYINIEKPKGKDRQLLIKRKKQLNAMTIMASLGLIISVYKIDDMFAFGGWNIIFLLSFCVVIATENESEEIWDELIGRKRITGDSVD